MTFKNGEHQASNDTNANDDDLPRFGASSRTMEAPKFKDPYQAEHDELDNIVGSLLSKEEPSKADTSTTKNKN